MNIKTGSLASGFLFWKPGVSEHRAVNRFKG